MKIKEARNNYGHKGPFWYFTTHGVQPGSIPKGVHVLEIRDGQNDKGTMGTFVALDGVLTYDELREYDMKEMSPKIKEGLKENKKLKEELYDIFYDYEDEEGYVWRDNKEEFEGDWHELQNYIKSMRRYGCYNIDAVYREGSSGEYDYELEEDANEKMVIYTVMGDYYVTPKSNYGGRFQNSRKVHHMRDFESAREVMDYWNKYFHTTDDDFEVIDEGCKRKVVKEDIADNDIDKVYKRLSKLNNVDFGKLEDEYLRTRPSVGDAVFKFYGTVLNMNYYCKDFVNWVKEEKGIDLKGIPCKKNESLKEGMNKKDIAKRLVRLAYDYDYYDFMDSLEVGETMEDAIVRIERDLDNPKYVRGIISWLKEVVNDEYIDGDDIPQRAKRLIKELRGER